MKRRIGLYITALSVLLVTTGCESMKSSNPLTPTVAGPIPGVDISAPKPLEPNNVQIAVDQQPVELLLENALSSGVRPLTYLFEVATDAGFTNKVFSRDGVPPGEGGRTNLRLPDALGSGRSYYWRARAADGANTGPYSGAANFNVFTPIVIDRPRPASPINNVKIGGGRPQFTILNGPRSGPVGAISYMLELSDTATFENKVAIWSFDEQPNQTHFDAPIELAYLKQYFWHVRAFDASMNGPWSDTQVFQTPDPPVVFTPPSGGGGGGGSGPVGPWDSCGSTPGPRLVECVHAAVNPAHSAAGAFEVTKRVAWLLRGSGAGLLIKNGGENIVSWQGKSFAAARIVYPDGHYYKLLTDVPTTNGPGWHDEGVDPGLIKLYHAPIQP